MKRTIKEIYEIIVKKRNSAYNHYTRIKNTHNSISVEEKYLLNNLKGEIEAYTDVLALLESSGVVENELIR